MHRRTFIGGLTGGAAAATAGCLGAVYPRTAGTVTSKLLWGYDGDRRLPLAAQEPAGIDVVVDDDALAAALKGDGERLVVDSSLAARLEAAYDRVDYRVDLALTAPDPTTGGRPGETVVYVVDRATFNAAPVGVGVEARVARFGTRRLVSLTVPGDDGGRDRTRGGDGLSGTGA